ncbi:MAG: carbohydrate porin [Tepidisphaeraceae bacterium]|jgi:high affinity Mn2+ porin
MRIQWDAMLLALLLFGAVATAVWADPGQMPPAVPTSAPSATPPAPNGPSGSSTGTGGPEQNWNWHVQNTDIVQGYPAFPAKYSGPNSLPPGGQIRETVSVDLYSGVRLWSGAEAHIDGLMWQGFGLGNTEGIEGFPNGEAVKEGTGPPDGTIARLFIRQTIGFGGDQEDVPDDELTLAGKQDISRLTLTIGKFSATDIFDNNAYAGDPRTQFMSWPLMANATWDYPMDTVGYTTGIALELNQPKWTLRYGFFQMPQFKNGFTAEDEYLVWPTQSQSQDGPFLSSWGMVTEFERRYNVNAHPGTIRFLAWLNEADMASYSAAIPILEANGVGADISAARAYRYKYGFGLNWEQEIANNVGVFSRLGWNDGQEEAWTFTDANWTASLGLSVKGESWHRPDDTFGVAGVVSGASSENQKFLEAGGLDVLDGDGALTYAPEKSLETYYDFLVFETVHAAFDYQFIADPAFNSDRGPVSVFGVRIHFER